jgi:hypothetical protein
MTKCPHCGQAMPGGPDPSEAMKFRICGWFQRRLTTVWDRKELVKLKEVAALGTPEEDLKLLDIWFAASDTYHRRDVLTLLNNWNSEIDRARAYQPKPARGQTFTERWRKEQGQP